MTLTGEGNSDTINRLRQAIDDSSVDKLVVLDISKMTGLRIGEREYLTSYSYRFKITFFFRDCKNLKEIVLPDRFEVKNENEYSYLGSNSFNGCTNLTAINVTSENTELASSSGCLYTKNMKELVIVAPALTSVTIPDSVTKIRKDAFAACSDLTTINVTDSNTEFAASDGCLYYKDTKGLVIVTPGLTSVTIPNGVTSISQDAFYGCTRLTSVTIPNSVTSIHKLAFNACSDLTTINVTGSNTKFAASGGCLYTKNMKELVRAPRGLTSLTISNSVETIKEYAFYGCSITSVTIPESVSSIGVIAFGSSSLTSVVIPESVVSMGVMVFNGCRELASATIPYSLYSVGLSNGTYLPGGNFWYPQGGNHYYCDSLFSSCDNLTNITYNNTKRHWSNSMYADKSVFDSHRLNYITVTCTDGSFKLSDAGAFAQ